MRVLLIVHLSRVHIFDRSGLGATRDPQEDELESQSSSSFSNCWHRRFTPGNVKLSRLGRWVSRYMCKSIYRGN